MRKGIRHVISSVLPADEFVVELSAWDYFRRIEARFPICGSKVSWDEVPSALDYYQPRWSPEGFSQRAVELVRDVVNRGLVRSEATAVIFADGPDDEAVTLTIDGALAVLPQLLGLPQHTYIADPTASWCFCFTTEGGLSFGFATR